MFKNLRLLLIALFVPVVCSGEARRAGFVLPLTGKAAIAGEAVRNGAMMANEAKGQPFELVFEDNALDNTRTIGCVRKLIDTDRVGAIVVYASGPSNTVAPVAETAKLPMVGLSVDPNVSRLRKWVMIHWASNEAVAERLFAELARRKLRKVAVVTTQVQGDLDLEKVFIENAKSNGVEIVFSQQVLPSEADFSATIGRMKAAKPQAVFLDLYYGQSGVFARQSLALGFSPQFFGHFVLDDDSEIAASQGALNGAFFANTSGGDLSSDQEYLARFGKRAVLGAISAYDVVTLLALAFRNTDGSAAGVNQYLHTVAGFEGKIGRYGALPNNSFDVPAGLGEIRDGGIVKFSQR